MREQIQVNNSDDDHGLYGQRNQIRLFRFWTQIYWIIKLADQKTFEMNNMILQKPLSLSTHNKSNGYKCFWKRERLVGVMQRD